MTESGAVDAWSVSDGVVVIRPPLLGDPELLVAGRDGDLAVQPKSIQNHDTALLSRWGAALPP